MLFQVKENEKERGERNSLRTGSEARSCSVNRRPHVALIRCVCAVSVCVCVHVYVPQKGEGGGGGGELSVGMFV